MDYDLPFFNNRFALRLFQADFRYVHADFGPANNGNPLGGRANINAAELSTGIVTHFGSIVPPPPVTYSCVASPTTVYPGDPITVTGTALNLNPKKTATYTWASDGGTISGTSSTANLDTKTAAPGSYTVKGHVMEGSKPTEVADCTAPFTVKAFEPPTISCSASPSTVDPGGSSTITATGTSPQNRPLTYSYSSTAGSVSGTSSTATLSTSGATGTITVTCNVVDDKGQTASSTTSVSVNQPPPPPAPKPSSLCSIQFDRDPRRPARVNNEAKACLDDIALNLQRSSDAKVALVGNAGSSEKSGPKLAAERAVNTKAYLVKEKGIDSSRIAVYTGTEDGKTVNTTLIPSGATLNGGSITPVDESAVMTPTPGKKHHKKK
jgi:outer membrane protein OmpA-like peptidoglycan-associated protein